MEEMEDRGAGELSRNLENFKGPLWVHTTSLIDATLLLEDPYSSVFQHLSDGRSS